VTKEERELIYKQLDDIGDILVFIGKQLIYIKVTLQQEEEMKGGDKT
jgi:hypothetical protein